MEVFASLYLLDAFLYIYIYIYIYLSLPNRTSRYTALHRALHGVTSRCHPPETGW